MPIPLWLLSNFGVLISLIFFVFKDYTEKKGKLFTLRATGY